MNYRVITLILLIFIAVMVVFTDWVLEDPTIIRKSLNYIGKKILGASGADNLATEKSSLPFYITSVTKADDDSLEQFLTQVEAMADPQAKSRSEKVILAELN